MNEENVQIVDIDEEAEETDLAVEGTRMSTNAVNKCPICGRLLSKFDKKCTCNK